MATPRLKQFELNSAVTMSVLLCFLFLVTAFLHTLRETNQKQKWMANQACTREVETSSGQGQLNDWFPVPDWLAGTWQAGSQTVLEAYDHVQGTKTIDSPTQVETARRSTIGMQQDGLGRVWYCAATPYERTVETTAFVEHQLMEKISLLSSSPNEITVDCLATVTRSAREFGATNKTFKEETITTYRPVGDGLVQASFIINDFDMDGHPLISSRAIATTSRIEPFREIDADERGDLRLKFHQFMQSHGLGYLVAHK